MKESIRGWALAAIVGGVSVWGCGFQKQPRNVPNLEDSGELPNLPASVWGPLVRTFERQARGIDPKMQASSFAHEFSAAKTQVKVVLIDAVPENDVRPNRNVHSVAMRSVIANLSCHQPNPADCRERVNLISTKFPREIEYPSLTVDQLTESVQQAVAQAASKRERLIINFAVGLDPVKLALSNVRIEPLVNALIDASCQGALVIAPAGNLTGSEGPLLPAAFESKRAPTLEVCQKRGFPNFAGTREPYAPLVYAVGGLDGLDQRLQPSRPWSMPRIAAFGLEASASEPGDQPYSFPLTGTSISSAIVTGVAAALWLIEPEWDPHRVMAHVYRGGVPLDGGRRSMRARTEFCLGSPFGPCTDPVRRVFLCGALASAFPDKKLKCVETPATSLELPSWPDGTKPMIPPAPVCSVTGCNLAFGTNTAQIANGAVPQQPISGCPGCGVQSTLDRIKGLIKWTSTAPVMQYAVLATWDASDNPINLNYYLGNWTSDQEFNIPLGTPISAQTASASIGVVHDNGKVDWVGIIVPGH